MKITNFAEAERLLNAFVPRPLDVREVYMLDTIRALLAFLGNPQDSLRVVHVAGTSGKTSTAYYIAALLKASGRTVGLTTSPHIQSINERVQVNLVPLPEAMFCQKLGEYMDLVQQSGLKPTYFELMMAFVYWEFARQGVDYAVIEVGLGGLLDGSNVVTRADKVCVITDIGYDHTAVLGSTLPEIATQKAGIILPHNDVFMHAQTDVVMEVMRATCQAKQATLHVIAPATPRRAKAFLPLFQQRNFELAITVVEHVLGRDGHQPLTATALDTAAHVRIPGRMETFRFGNKTIILDGAHNPQKLQAMATSLRALYPTEPIAALVGFVSSKEVGLPDNASVLAELAQHAIVTEFEPAQEHGRPSIEAHVVVEACRAAGLASVVEITDKQQALQALLKRPEPLLLVTGSLYLVSFLRSTVLEHVTNLPPTHPLPFPSALHAG